MKNIKIITLISLLLTLILSAQEFKLSDYQAPEISRMALWFDGSVSNDFYYQSSYNYSHSYDYYTYSNLSSFGNLYFKNQQFETTTDASYKGYTNDFFGYGNMSINNLSRWYFFDDFFISCEPNVELAGYGTKSMEKLYLGSFVRIGWGRIEHTEDARLALYILDDLKDKDLLNNYPNKDKIIELSALITKLKNERIIDTREKKIYEITQLDSFFQTNGLLKNTNAIYFTILTDNWENCGSPQRLNGMRISAGFRYNYTYDIKEIANPSSEMHEGYSYQYGNLKSPEINFEWSKPLNLKWQLDNSFKTNYYFNSTKWYYYIDYIRRNSEGNSTYYQVHIAHNDTSKVDWETIIVENNFKLSYYYNSRTFVESILQLNYEWYNYKEIEHRGSILAMVNWNYHLSDNLILKVDYKYLLKITNENSYLNYPEKKRIWRIGSVSRFSLGATYSLF